jgi:hypothetical protein
VISSGHDGIAGEGKGAAMLSAIWRSSLLRLRSITLGVICLTGFWTAFQVWDPTPPPVLDQILVAAFGIWFATEARRNTAKLKAKEEDEEKEKEDGDD